MTNEFQFPVGSGEVITHLWFVPNFKDAAARERRTVALFVCLSVSVSLSLRLCLCLSLSLSKYFFVPCGKFGSPYLGKVQQPREQLYPFSLCLSVSLSPQVLLCPVREIRVALPGESTAAARVALPIPISVFAVFSCVQTMIWLPVFGILKSAH